MFADHRSHSYTRHGQFYMTWQSLTATDPYTLIRFSFFGFYKTLDRCGTPAIL